MDHKAVAERVLAGVGGLDNIRAGAHCATRLRLVLKDMDLIDQEALDNDPDLKGTFNNSGQFQIIVGPGDVNEVYKVMAAQGMRQVSKDELKSVAAEKGNIVTRFLKMISDIFLPIIPVLVGAGMLMALNNVLTAPNLFGADPLVKMYPQWADFAAIINLLSAAAFAFLPVLVGYSATKVFGGNPYLGLTMGAAMVFPSLANGYTVAQLLEGPITNADGTTTVMQYWDLFGLKVAQAGYQGTVLPIMLVAFILANIEKFFHKLLKGVIDFIFTPTLTILITGFLTFIAVGPVMFKAGTLLGESINNLYTAAGPVGGFIFGLLYSPIVITGLHQSFPPIELQLLNTGGSFIFVIASMANVSQGGAALGVFLTAKNEKLKGIAGASAPSAFLGITEPAIFGVNLRLRWPFFIAMGSSAIASALVALLGVKATSLGAAGYLGFVSISPTIGAGWAGFFGCLILATVLSTGASYFYGRRVFAQEAAVATAGVATAAAASAASSAAVAAPAASSTAVSSSAVNSTNGYDLTAHLTGTAMELASVSDPVFSGGALGPGAAIEPTVGKLVAPADGKVTVAYPTGHAIGMKTAQGLEVLMHVGLDTVELDGKFFTPLVVQGQEVKRGDVLVEFDVDGIRGAGYQLATPLVITNAKKTVQSTGLKVAAGSEITAESDFLAVEALADQT